MSHQPFETWLLEPEGLGQKQRANLEQHLSECARCRQLASFLQEVDQILRAATVIGPRQGFTGRFSTALHRKREHRRRMHTLLLLAGTLVGSVLILAALILLGIPQLAGMGSEVLQGTVASYRQVAVLTELGWSLLWLLDLTTFPLVMLWPALVLGLASVAAYPFCSVVWTALYLRLTTQPLRWSRRL